ncbi:MAG: metallophosphoesterase family protein [Pseudomonadota bacterium]
MSPHTLPEGVRVYAIGDVHGELALLDKLLARIDDDLARNPHPNPIEIHLGDMVDRGGDSAGVLDRLIATSPRQRIVLKGNHEAMFQNALKGRGGGEWLANGGDLTMAAYGVAPRMASLGREGLSAALTGAVPEAHRTFLAALPLTHRLGDVLFVHAGIRPGVPLEYQDQHDLMWIRDPFMNHEGSLPVRVVHGHTPVHAAEATPHRVSVDTGAYVTGLLTCAVMEGTSVRFLDTGR